MKKSQFVEGKSVWKGLKICTYMFLGMPIAMHYVRTLCDKYFLSYDGLSELSMTKNEKKTLICAGIMCWKAWILVHIGFWVCLIAMKYVRTLCDKYFLSYDGFLLIFDRKVYV